jgi:hypothetical protein
MDRAQLGGSNIDDAQDGFLSILVAAMFKNEA